MPNYADIELKVLNKIKDLLGNNSVCIGTQTLTVDNNVVQLTVPSNASYAFIQVQSDATGKAVRYWSDGLTVPTSTDGLFRANGEAFDILSAQTASQIKFTQAQAGTHTLFIEYYKQ